MVLPLVKASKPAAKAQSEIEIRRWSEPDYQSAAAVITTAYRGHVDSQINDQYIVRFPGCGTFDPDSSFVAVHKQTRSLAGLILCSRVRHDVGHVTQLCVLPEYRSHGIGQSLLAATAVNLQQRNFSTLSLTVTEANTHAIDLYRYLGFDIKRVFDAFVWEG